MTFSRKFFQQVKNFPDRVAVIDKEGQYSYLEIAKRVTCLTHSLEMQGVACGDIVAVNMPRSVDLIVTILAIWQVRGIYLPLETGYPEARIAFIFEDAQPKLVLKSLKETERFREHNMFGDSPEEQLIEPRALDEDVAWILYTSGSTGRPNGVLVTHGAASRGLLWDQAPFDYGSGNKYLFKAPLNFLTSIYEIFTPLISGGTVVILPQRQESNLKEITNTVCRHQVSYVEFVPSLLGPFLEYIEGKSLVPDISCLKGVLVSGEALPPKLVTKFNDLLLKINGTRLINTYGLTETSVDILYCDCSQYDSVTIEGASRVPIGRPVAGVGLYILDNDFKPVPEGEAGSLWVVGDTLAKGYLNRPELTAERFRPLPHLGEKRAYNTGDLVRKRPDGDLEYLGRADFQVKVRGQRVDLQEIEFWLTRYSFSTKLGLDIKVKQVVVHPWEQGSDPDLGVGLGSEVRRGGICLVAYVVWTKALAELKTVFDEVRLSSFLREYLKTNLPDYMVPNQFIFLDSLPVNPNGKVDRKSLPKPRKEAGVAPIKQVFANATEEKVARIWQRLLDSQAFGPEDGFFSIGGHSLLVIGMDLELQKEFKKEIPIYENLANLTVRNISRMLEEQPLRLSRSGKKIGVQLNFRQEKTIFCFPPVTGFGFYYRPLAEQISEWGVYGFDFVPEHDRIPRYIGQILKRQKNGPYILLGYSAGGILAFEVAREMERLGLDVSHLIMIDTERQQVVRVRTEEQLLQEIDDLFSDIVFKEFKQYLHNVNAEKYVVQRTLAYLRYLDSLVPRGSIKGSLHLLLGEGSCLDWSGYGLEGVYYYQGKGSHYYMMHGAEVQRNSQIICDILR